MSGLIIAPQSAGGSALGNTPGTLVSGTDGTSIYPLKTDNTGAVVTVGGSGTSANQIQGNVAAGATDSGNPVKVGAKVNTPTLPTYVDGQRTDLQAGTRGSLNVTLFAQDSTTAATLNGIVTDGVAAGAALRVAPQTLVFNGATWDRARKFNGFSRIASTAASGSPTVAKASAGDAGAFWGQNGAAITYLQFYNVATTPVVGTTAIVATFPIAALERFTTPPGWAGTYFSTGFAYAFTTDAAGTTAAAAAAVTSFLTTYA